ncbi:MAG: hypothetical protein ACK4R8_02265 [Thiobacillus sp.]
MSTNPFVTPSACRAAFDAVLARAPRELRLYDRDIGLWQLDDPARHAALRALCVAGGGRRIECLLDDVTRVVHALPRLMQLLRDFSHVLAIRQADPHTPRPDQAWVLANRHDVVFRPDKNAPHGALYLDDPAHAVALHQTFESLWQRAQAPLSATTLGL